MTLHLIETLNTSIYNQKHTNNTKVHVRFYYYSHFSKLILIQKLDIQNNHRLMLIFMVASILLRATQPN